MGVRLAKRLLGPASHLRGTPARLTAVSVILAAVVVVGCWMDGTLNSSTKFVGLSTHWGYYAMFLLTPGIILLTGWLADEYTSAIKNTRSYCIDRHESDVRELVRKHLQRLEFRGYWPRSLVIVVFLASWLFNYEQTSSSQLANEQFGNYVFDSLPFSNGFYSAKLYLFFVMVFVYSSAVFTVVSVATSMYFIFGFIDSKDALRIDLFDADHCGGLSRFGNINLIALTIYAVFSIVSLADALTHTKLYPLMFAALALCFVSGFAHSWFALGSIARSVDRSKREKLEITTAQLRLDVESWHNNGRFSSDFLVLRNYLMTIRNYPYPAHIRLYFLSAFSPLAAVLGFLKTLLIRQSLS
ncbi:MAG TPA: hypothetical protein VGC72_16045 [Candidatus Elarobacter sp.]